MLFIAVIHFAFKYLQEGWGLNLGKKGVNSIIEVGHLHEGDRLKASSLPYV